MKKFILTTEYNQPELELLIEKILKKVLSEQLNKLAPHLANPPPKSNLQNLLNRKEVTKILRISYPTLLKLEKQGVLKGSIVLGRYRYTEEQISKYLQSTNLKSRSLQLT